MNELQSAKAPWGVAMQIGSVKQYFQVYQKVLGCLPYAAIEEAKEALLRGYEQDQSIFLFGNGGSAALASHFACDLGKGAVVNGNGQKRFRVLALTDNVALMTAWANDTCYERVFAEQLHNFVAPGDVALAISGSGNSPNVLCALEVAREAGRQHRVDWFSGGGHEAFMRYLHHHSFRKHADYRGLTPECHARHLFRHSAAPLRQCTG